MHLQIIAEKGHHYKSLEVDSNVINIRLCCFDAQQMRLKKYCSTNLPMSLKIFHDWQMGTLFDDLNTHVHNPEALVVGVVSDCPAKLLLGVQQTVGTPRSGICKVSNGQKTRFR